MAHFRATLSNGSAAVMSRTGTRARGLEATIGGWAGQVRVRVWHAAGHDHAEVWLADPDTGRTREVLWNGPLTPDAPPRHESAPNMADSTA
jgi:hypothetical protein